MLVNEIVGIVGSSEGASMTEEEGEGMGLDEDAVEMAEGGADDDGDDVGAWFDGPAPLMLRIGMLGLKISPTS